MVNSLRVGDAHPIVVLPFGTGFSGSPSLPQKALEATQAKVERTTSRLVGEGAHLKRVSGWLDVSAFGIMTLLTFIGGFVGVTVEAKPIELAEEIRKQSETSDARPPTNNQDFNAAANMRIQASNQHITRRAPYLTTHRLALAVGVLSAAASASNAAANKFASLAEARFKAADDLQERAEVKRAAIDASDGDESVARRLLHEIEMEAEKCP
jgi:hypothetical protein